MGKMIYRHTYCTPDGFDDMMMSCDGEFLTGLRFINSCDRSEQDTGFGKQELPVFKETRRWLDNYFSGRQPDFTPMYRIENLTPFRKEVTDIMLSIPFGATMTYGDIAAKIAAAHGIKKMSSRAVGGAVGWNPLCIIIPCHRVVGANKKLTGYGGGIENKIALLKLEGYGFTSLSVCKLQDFPIPAGTVRRALKSQ